MDKSTAGYSGTPLAKKLGIKPNFMIRVINKPDHYFDLFSDLPARIRITDDKKNRKDLIHYFETGAEMLIKNIPLLKNEISANGAIWVSWYKKSSKMETDITEDLIRKTALAAGLVDVKVCAIDDQWSGLKLVIPVKDR